MPAVSMKEHGGSHGRMLSYGLAGGAWANISDEDAEAGGVTLVRTQPTPEDMGAYTESAFAEAVAGGTLGRVAVPLLVLPCEFAASISSSRGRGQLRDPG